MVLRSSLLESDALVHGFSTRAGGVSTCYRGSGDLNLGFTKDDDRAAVRENRLRFLSMLGASDFCRFGLVVQQHSPVVRVLRNADEAAAEFTEPASVPGDGLITNVPGVLLAVLMADCIPVLVFDPVRRVVGAFHAGWRGTVAGIVGLGVAAMRDAFGCEPTNMVAAVGPGIGPASYEVSADVRDAFVAAYPYGDALFDDAMRLNLWEANRRQLVDAGLSAGRVDVLGLNTAADTQRFFSHRAENGFTGRMMGAIGLVR